MTHDGRGQRMLGAALDRRRSDNSVASSVFGSGRTSTTRGSPTVSVPVLSNTTVSMVASRSSGSPPLINRPAAAPRPVATITAVGTARPIAHGHAMISTATAGSSARTTDGVSSANHHTPNVTSAMPMTIGTNTAEMRSASRWIGACDA